MNAFIFLQEKALEKARAKHQPMQTRHEAYAVILEELDEFWEQVKNGGNDTPAVDNEKLLKELTHVAAMCQRAAEDLSLLLELKHYLPTAAETLAKLPKINDPIISEALADVGL